jgi:pantoate--beta-alanine ligase
MKIFKSIRSYQKWRRSIFPRHTVGFVPTMGALHAGHLSLVEKSKKNTDKTVVSIFVNPLQFGPKEDFKKYPRPWKKDFVLLKRAGVDAVFMPSGPDMYPPGFQTRVSVPALSGFLCGSPKLRGSEHFVGVATVVLKLLNIVQPSKAFFGLKDFQQVRVLEQMVQDLNLTVAIVRCPIVREPGGLAMSSRNAYLSSSEKQAAAKIRFALQRGQKLLTSSRKMTLGRIRQNIIRILKNVPGFQVEYVEAVDPQTLRPLTKKTFPALLAAAVRVGPARLIDNLLIHASKTSR